MLTNVQNDHKVNDKHRMHAMANWELEIGQRCACKGIAALGQMSLPEDIWDKLRQSPAALSAGAAATEKWTNKAQALHWKESDELVVPECNKQD